jgi:ATP-binding cassette, subfamily B, bacterial
MRCELAERPKTLPRFLVHFLKKQWIWFLLVQICWFAWSIDQTLFPFLFGKIIDGFSHFTTDRSLAFENLQGAFIGVVALWIGVEISFRCGGFIMARHFPIFEANIRLYMFEYVQQHSTNYFANQFAGALSNKISDMARNVSAAMRQNSHLIFLIKPSFSPFVKHFDRNYSQVD